jgi:hypothetical protein
MMRFKHICVFILFLVTLGLLIALNPATNPAIAPATASATGPATATTGPSSRPAGLLLGAGSSAVVTTRCVVGQAPCVLWADARAVSLTRTETLNWNFGDGSEFFPNPRHCGDPLKYPAATLSANTDCVGQVAAHWFLNPATYHCSCTVHHTDGTTSVYPFDAIVLPDQRRQIYFSPNGDDANDGSISRPLKSPAKFCAVASTSNVRIHLDPAWISGPLPESITLQTNVAIDGNGATINPPPSGPAFVGWVGVTADDLIRNVTFASTTQPTTTQPAQGVRFRGTRLSLIDCRFGPLWRAAEVADGNSDGLLFHGNVQLSPTAIPSQVLYVGGGSHVVIQFNRFTGSVGESPLRFDGSSVNGATVAFNIISQPTQAKAAFTDRHSLDVSTIGNWFDSGDCSHNVGIADPAAYLFNRVTNSVVRDNLITSTRGTATIQISAGVVGYTATNNDVRVRPGCAAVTVSPDWTNADPLTDVLIQDTAVKGTNASLLKLNGGAGYAVPTIPGATAWPGLFLGKGNTVNGKS